MSVPVMNDLKALGSRLQPRWFLAPIGVLVAAAVSMLLIGIPIWLAWLTTEHGDNGPRELLDLIGSAWLGIQNVPLDNGTQHFSILPWGLVVIPIFTLYRAGRLQGRAARSSRLQELSILVIVASLTYAAVMVLVAHLTATDGLHAPILQAALTGLVIAAGSFAIALLRTTEQGNALLTAIPKGIWTVIRAGATGVLTLLGAGALLALISLVWHFWQAREIFEFLDAGVFGGLLITIACIGYLPVLIMWATAYLLGPGIAIGPGIGLSPFMPTPPPTELPAFPLLAALPEKVGPLAWGLPIIAVLIGVGVGITCVRGGPLPALLRLASATAACAGLGLVIGFLAWFSAGSLGDVRLLSIGPDAVFAGLLAFGLTAIGAIPAALALRAEEAPRIEQPRDKYYNVAVVQEGGQPGQEPVMLDEATDRESGQQDLHEEVQEDAEVQNDEEATAVEASGKESEQIHG